MKIDDDKFQRFDEANDGADELSAWCPPPPGFGKRTGGGVRHPRSLQNLRLKPYSPNKFRGRIQVQIRRAFVSACRDTLSAGELYDWIFPRDRDVQYKPGHRLTVCRELRRIANRVGRAPTRGRPWLWRLKDPAAYLGESADIFSAADG